MVPTLKYGVVYPLSANVIYELWIEAVSFSWICHPLMIMTIFAGFFFIFPCFIISRMYDMRINHSYVTSIEVINEPRFFSPLCDISGNFRPYSSGLFSRGDFFSTQNRLIRSIWCHRVRTNYVILISLIFLSTWNIYFKQQSNDSATRNYCWGNLLICVTISNKF